MRPNLDRYAQLRGDLKFWQDKKEQAERHVEKVIAQLDAFDKHLGEK